MRGGSHLTMKSLVQLFNEWEIQRMIQLLVLVSFTIQFFLFFAGGLRRRIRSSVLRSLIWLAYLGADLVAAYVLGLISRQEVSTHHLFFLWLPFLLIHLGGQDTITTFAIEDNKLWGRHLLNLVVQVSLTMLLDNLGQRDRQSRKLVKVFFRTREQKLWISKLLDTKFVQVDEQIMRCVVRRIAQYRHPQEDGSSSPQAGQWQNLGPFLRKIVRQRASDFDHLSIIGLHLFTEVLLSRYVRTGTAMDSESSDASVRVCRMISQYMVYLLVTHLEMLPISSDREVARLLAFVYEEVRADNDMMRQAISALTSIDMPDPPGELTEAHLLELLHAASKSRPEMHAALLAKGGELLTFIWLLMAHYLKPHRFS